MSICLKLCNEPLLFSGSPVLVVGSPGQFVHGLCCEGKGKKSISVFTRLPLDFIWEFSGFLKSAALKCNFYF